MADIPDIELTPKGYQALGDDYENRPPDFDLLEANLQDQIAELRDFIEYDVPRIIVEELYKKMGGK